MNATTALHHYLRESARRVPEHVAVVEPGAGTITYAAIDKLSDQVCDWLRTSGVQPGDRVGLYLRKSIDAVAAIYGILKAGAAYVPVDAGAPPSRNAYILHNCAVSALVVETRFEEQLKAEHASLSDAPLPPTLRLGTVGAGRGVSSALQQSGVRRSVDRYAAAPTAAGDLAYILYTSGSTGRPKGVMLSHDNAVSFVDWCSELLRPQAGDRFSSHAPFHFDLSILDIHVSIKHGATLVLVGEDVGKDPERLAQLIAAERITIWYSAPSILALLGQFGKLGECDLSALRIILFAGEVFPIKHLRALTQLLPDRRYINLYGPTETNVCTFHEVRLPIADAQSQPVPIGVSCSHLQCKVVNEQGAAVAAGDEGELVVAGRGVMQGYWALPEQTARAFLIDGAGQRWYRTGDLVFEDKDGNYVYVGRRDRMVKRRGYRVELGEIESGLYRHPLVKEAAVVAVADEDAGVRIKAFLSCQQAKRPSLIEMKRFCAQHLPLYMIPDVFVWQEALPRTSTDKLDYQRLAETR
jgi:amino acid adenylation domain-containing protein